MNGNSNIANFNWDLLARYFNGEASEQEQYEVNKWVNQSEENHTEFLRLKHLLQGVDTCYEKKKFDTDHALSRVMERIEPSVAAKPVYKFRPGRLVYILQRVAAVLIIALIIGGGAYLLTRNGTPGIETVVSDYHPLPSVTLPDGTIVTLNAGSKLTYPETFTPVNRKVTIAGEAFFEVTPDPQRPFIIHAGEAQVKVLGTSFNVTAYPGDEKVEVIVETGKVLISGHPDTGEKVTEIQLLPGEKGTLRNAQNELTKSTNTDPNFIAWKTHTLIFREITLYEVIETLKRTYRVDISTENIPLEELQLTAHFENKEVDFVLEVIRRTFNLDIINQDGQYILRAQI